MQWYHLTILAIAAVAFLASRGTPRASLWIAAVVMAYIGPVLYLHMPQPDWVPWSPPPSGVSFLFDGLVYFLITHKHEEAWEKRGGIYILARSVSDVWDALADEGIHPQ